LLPRHSCQRPAVPTWAGPELQQRSSFRNFSRLLHRIATGLQFGVAYCPVLLPGATRPRRVQFRSVRRQGPTSTFLRAAHARSLIPNDQQLPRQMAQRVPDRKETSRALRADLSVSSKPATTCLKSEHQRIFLHARGQGLPVNDLHGCPGGHRLPRTRPCQSEQRLGKEDERL